MYIYGKILSEFINNAYYLTNDEKLLFNSIINSCKFNNNKYKLINYNNKNLFEVYDGNCEKTFLIANVSKNGLKNNLISEISLIKPKYLIIIHCSYESYFEDNIILIKYNYKYHTGTIIESKYKIYISCYLYSNYFYKK